MPTHELHVSAAARERYGIEGALFSLSGDLVLPDLRTARRVAQGISVRRAGGADPERIVNAGELNALGLIHEVGHLVLDLYRERRSPDATRRALEALGERPGGSETETTLRRFLELFPPRPVASGEQQVADYLAATAADIPRRELVLEELLLLWLANVNPAADGLRELFDDRELARATAYRQLITALGAFYAGEPRFGPSEESVIAMLRAPALASPDSLIGQLRFIRERWGPLLGRLADRVAISLDVLAEEELGRWRRLHPGGPPQSTAPSYIGLDADEERFSADRDWMPRLVLMAKSTYVWLDQLSGQYQRDIHRLDQIPDEELDRLARYGFTGLWLIGLWQRSSASQRIKQLRGNPEAVASAYSLDEYRIADDLGGDPAYENLRDRAWQRGIRLASDMVPNHMGIDSRWVMEHPDWFIGLDHAPYPAYSFSGPDLSPRPGVGIFLEDHYYDGSDAAVVFRRTDAHGERYLYHGNDGTSMPWNDTAQLDYLNPEVREAVIQTILEVARRFPVIRFDAAMTLARRHVQRLWYPEPGSGGTAIPSRAEYGAMSGDEFAWRMPVEFWREVVDRVAAEVPDTLLLAEAFWMMEGYFVRTLGMHRVYNSAFMNMLRDEKNAEYRGLIRQTLEFDPEILKRYVNFMNNPDEKTAVEQFGKGDKYFGIATLMVTLPGLPMFGHGQIEGYAEKYGMEFRRAYWDEQPDSWLVERHEREIVPLLHRRAAFAEVRDFLLYDLVTDDGGVDENVFAYSNVSGGERSLVIYHNRYGSTAGRLRESAAYAARRDGRTDLERRTLGQGLGLTDDPARFTIMRDLRGGLEYLRSSAELCREGLWIALDAYRCHVFADLREIHDAAGLYRRLAERLGGAGVPSIEEALRELELEPVADALRGVLEADHLGALAAGGELSLDRFSDRLARFAELVRERVGGEGARDAARHARELLTLALERPELTPQPAAERRTRGKPARHPQRIAELLAWVVIGTLPRPGLLDELRLAPVLASALRGLGIDEGAAWRSVDAGRLLAELPALPAHVRAGAAAADLWRTWLADATVRRFLGVNRHDGVEWFNRESLDELLSWIAIRAALRGDLGGDGERVVMLGERLRDAARRAGYRLDAMSEALAAPARSARRRTTSVRSS